MTQISFFFIFSMVGGLFSMVTLSLQRKHLLSCLLSLEAMTLTLFIFLLSESSSQSFESFTALILITLAACEASLGLAILVSLIRTHGNDYVYNYNLQKC
uniref:NADH dehydrogenase subunit 4L n=1 Tax=Gigantopelta aegis TaxID=1735272 RepID=UPI001EE08F11|nr:NADH dehydrogenase subunit 4L [Gigantopelta aegis]UFK31939.1 NADH dehydrogenase subunit 4L [Gigantopelta aegis]UKE79907.1 NADH dehydrogenase subunit 4L [Gigantopelta aegis]